MFYSGELSKQNGAVICNDLVVHNNARSSKTASRERRKLWPASREVPTAVMVANEFVRYGLTSFLKGTQFRIVISAASLSEVNAVMDGQPTPALIIMGSDDAASANAVRALLSTFVDAKVVILRRSSAPQSLPKDVCVSVEAILDYDIAQKDLIAALAVVMSARELDVLRILATGASNKVIAQTCDMAEDTVKYHTKNILRKLRLPNRTQAAIWAHKHGICG